MNHLKHIEKRLQDGYPKTMVGWNQLLEDYQKVLHEFRGRVAGHSKVVASTNRLIDILEKGKIAEEK